MGKIKGIKVDLSIADDLASDQEKLIQEAQRLYGDIIAIATKLLPIAGKMSINQKKAGGLISNAKELGIDDLAKKLENISNNNISGNVIKASENIISSAKSYKL